MPIQAVLVGAHLVGVPLATAEDDGFVLLRAKLSSVFDPLVVGPRWDIELTVRNDGPARSIFMAVDEYPIVFDLPYTLWHEDASIGAGEMRSWTIRIDWSLPGFAVPMPDWFCVRVDHDWPPTRCWSVWTGSAAPDGAYPDSIEHPLLPGTPHGDL